jgi:hypothetical protein
MVRPYDGNDTLQDGPCGQFDPLVDPAIVGVAGPDRPDLRCCCGWEWMFHASDADGPTPEQRGALVQDPATSTAHAMILVALAADTGLDDLIAMLAQDNRLLAIGRHADDAALEDPA